MTAGALALPETLDLRAAAPLLEDLRGRIESPLVVDGAGVQRLGALCLQVLLSARASWAAAGQSFQIVNPSTALRETCALMGAGALTPSASVPSVSVPSVSVSGAVVVETA